MLGKEREVKGKKAWIEYGINKHRKMRKEKEVQRKNGEKKDKKIRMQRKRKRRKEKSEWIGERERDTENAFSFS
jgi:hypothetical protein